MEHLTHPVKTPVDLINADDDSTLWLGRLHFEPSDPMAVTLEMNTRSQGTIPWSFARDLLANGIFEPSGAGAVQVWPCLAADASAVVMIELLSGQGSLCLQIPSRQVHQFLMESAAQMSRADSIIESALDDFLDGLS